MRQPHVYTKLLWVVLLLIGFGCEPENGSQPKAPTQQASDNAVAPPTVKATPGTPRLIGGKVFVRKKNQGMTPLGADQVIQAYVGELEAVAQTLESVTTRDLAQLAVAPLTAAADKLADMKARIGTISPKLRASLLKKYHTRLQQVSQRLGAQSRRIVGNPNLSEPLREAMSNIPGLLSRTGSTGQ